MDVNGKEIMQYCIENIQITEYCVDYRILSKYLNRVI